MCLSIPGKIISVGKKIKIKYPKETREVATSIVEVKKGDYVIVSNKIIIAKLRKDEAEKALKLLK
jgi:hydrogenase maturation factor